MHRLPRDVNDAVDERPDVDQDQDPGDIAPDLSPGERPGRFLRLEALRIPRPLHGQIRQKERQDQHEARADGQDHLTILQDIELEHRITPITLWIRTGRSRSLGGLLSQFLAASRTG